MRCLRKVGAFLFQVIQAHSDRCLPCQRRATSIEHYTAAIGHDGTNHLYYGNRSFSYLNAGDFERSLADARVSTKIAPDFSKGFYRAGQALQGLKRYKEAAASYREGLKLDPANEDSQARLKECEKAVQAEAKLAKERRVPAYVIFTDRTLIDMAAKRPLTRWDFGEVNGVGESKLQQFADIFLAEITGFVRQESGVA